MIKKIFKKKILLYRVKNTESVPGDTLFRLFLFMEREPHSTPPLPLSRFSFQYVHCRSLTWSQKFMTDFPPLFLILYDIIYCYKHHHQVTHNFEFTCMPMHTIFIVIITYYKHRTARLYLSPLSLIWIGQNM